MNEHGVRERSVTPHSASVKVIGDRQFGVAFSELMR